MLSAQNKLQQLAKPQNPKPEPSRVTKEQNYRQASPQQEPQPIAATMTTAATMTQRTTDSFHQTIGGDTIEPKYPNRLRIKQAMENRKWNYDYNTHDHKNDDDHEKND